MRSGAKNSLERALAILELVALNPGGLTLSGIMRRLKIPSGTSHYILTRLAREGYLARREDTKRYEIGLKLVGIAHGALRDMGLRIAAEPVLHQLAAETKLCALVGVLERSHVMIVDKVEQPGMVKADLEIGVRYPAYVTALGKALLAQMRDAEASHYLDTYGVPKKFGKDANSKASFLKELRAIKTQGYATVDEELAVGVQAIAVPIPGMSGRAQAAVSATGARVQLDDRNIIDAVMRAAREIAKRLAPAGLAVS